MTAIGKHEQATAAYPQMRDYGSFSRFVAEFNGQTQTATYKVSRLPIDLLYSAKPGSRRLAVFFNSQQKPASLRLFTWQKVSRSFAANRLFIADPTVSAYEDLNLGWYAGGREINLQQHLGELIDFVRRQAGAEEIIFFGSSGGGYPAIYYSQYFPKSLAVTLAPTTTISNHSNEKLVDAWLSSAWEADKESLAGIAQVRTLDLPSHFVGGLSNPVLILQNDQDTDFINSQSRPLLESQHVEIVGSAVEADNLHLRLEPYGAGHMPPPAERVSRLAERISSIPIGGLTAADYSQILSETEFASDSNEN